MLDAAAKAGAERFVHLSSVVAFGFDYPEGVDEGHPLRTNGAPYVDTKVASEQVVLQAHAAGEVDCTIIRPGDVYGPGSYFWTVTPVREIAAHRAILPAMGRGEVSPVFVDDGRDQGRDRGRSRPRSECDHNVSPVAASIAIAASASPWRAMV